MQLRKAKQGMSDVAKASGSYWAGKVSVGSLLYVSDLQQDISFWVFKTVTLFSFNATQPAFVTSSPQGP